MVGTPDEHWHQGIDIFAPAGTPLLAAERGVVTRVGSGRLGGLTVWLRGGSGTAWYYAHLQSHQPGLEPGTEVEAGDVIGYVGNSGNAVSTPPHVHLEIHPVGGGPVNPYPLLNVLADRSG
jgi:murein DD-endopeptidase MepM/ murein hydrolase activator NlpD